MNLIALLTNIFSPGDVFMILVVVLVLFGPKKLPELARGLRQAMDEFNKAKHDVERELTKATEVPVQPAPGQQPRQPAELPPVPQPVAPVATVAAAPAAQPVPAQPQVFGAGDAFVGQAPQQAPQTHPAGQA